MKARHPGFLAVFPIALIALLSVAAHAAIPSSERDALIALYDSTDGDHWVASTNWRKETGESNDPGTECTWFGVTCDAEETTVLQLDLEQNGLIGTLPPELGDLVHLQFLSFNSYTPLSVVPIPPPPNELTGPIPPELGNLAELRVLRLCGLGPVQDGLSGAIPPELGDLAELEELCLGGNHLTGAIPPELGNLAKLESLAIAGNQLTGLIPLELGNLGSLKVLSVSINDPSGGSAGVLASLSKLQELYLSGRGSMSARAGQALRTEGAPSLG